MLTKKALGYIRISDPNDKSGISISRQRQQVIDKAKELGCDVEVFEDEGISGAKKNRHGFNNLMGKIQLRQYDYLIIPSIARFGRERSDLFVFFDRDVKKYNLRVLILDHPILQHDSPENHYMLGQFILHVDYERRLVSKRSKIAKEYNQRNGISYSGLPPYGYDKVRSHETIVKGQKKIVYKLIENTRELEVVDTIKKWSLEGKSQSEIRELLFRLKIPPQNKKSLRWSYPAIKRIIERVYPIFDTLRAS